MVDLKDIIGIWSGDFWLGASEPQIIKRHRSKTCPSKDLAISAPLDFPIFHRPYGLGQPCKICALNPRAIAWKKGRAASNLYFYVSADFWLNANQNF